MTNHFLKILKHFIIFMKNPFSKLLVILILFSISIYAQEDLEINIIDAYVTPEEPHTFKLNFFSSFPVKTTVKIDGKYKYEVSKNFSEDHQTEIDFSKFQFREKNVPYVILSEDENGKKYTSEEFEIILPYDQFIDTKQGSDPVSTVLFGLFLYFIPSPSLAIVNHEKYFSLTKEIPLITFYGAGYNYPSGNISIEYSHIYNALDKNFLRLGYKQFFQVKGIEYISPGITAFSNFDGYNGLGGELSIGWFNVYDVFTVYTRYRYNFKPSDTSKNFQEISIGLYSHFFTIDF